MNVPRMHSTMKTVSSVSPTYSAATGSVLVISAKFVSHTISPKEPQDVMGQLEIPSRFASSPHLLMIQRRVARNYGLEFTLQTRSHPGCMMRTMIRVVDHAGLQQMRVRITN